MLLADLADLETRLALVEQYQTLHLWALATIGTALIGGVVSLLVGWVRRKARGDK